MNHIKLCIVYAPVWLHKFKCELRYLVSEIPPDLLGVRAVPKFNAKPTEMLLYTARHIHVKRKKERLLSRETCLTCSKWMQYFSAITNSIYTSEVKEWKIIRWFGTWHIWMDDWTLVSWSFLNSRNYLTLLTCLKIFFGGLPTTLTNTGPFFPCCTVSLNALCPFELTNRL